MRGPGSTAQMMAIEKVFCPARTEAAGGCMEHRRGVMKCERCLGPMAYERVLYQGRIYDMWKCLMCGDVIDWIILLNRTHPSLVEEALKKKSEETFQEEIHHCA